MLKIIMAGRKSALALILPESLLQHRRNQVGGLIGLAQNSIAGHKTVNHIFISFFLHRHAGRREFFRISFPLIPQNIEPARDDQGRRKIFEVTREQWGYIWIQAIIRVRGIQGAKRDILKLLS